MGNVTHVTRRLALAAPAPAADACWQRLIHDWSSDATVDGRYPVACYRDAIANLPVDLLTYSSAPTDIDAALQARILAAPRATARAAAPSGDSGGLLLPLAVVGAGVLLLVGLLALIGAVRRNGRLQHALDTWRGS